MVETKAGEFMVRPEAYKSQIDFLNAVFFEWESRKPGINTKKRLHSLLDVNVSYQALRRFFNGKCEDFDLFEAVLRVLEVPGYVYKEAIIRWYPKMIRVAKRIHDVGKKAGKIEESANHHLDLFQRLITSEPLTSKFIDREWGKKGKEVVDQTVRQNQIIELDDGRLKVNSPDENIYLGEPVVKRLVEHNVEEYYRSKNPEFDSSFYRVFCLTKEKALHFKNLISEIFDLIDETNEETSEGDVVFAMSSLVRAVHIIN